MNSKSLLDEVIKRFKLDINHSETTRVEVEYWQQNTGLNDADLIDWTNEPFVTIDNPDSRDLDQALLIESVGDGFRCRYALADASYYVKPGSVLFNEALERGSSYYLPGQSIPMLPIELSEDLVSLNPSAERRALVFDMVLTQDGYCTHTQIIRAKINSFAKLSYEGVQRWLNHQPLPHDPTIPEAAKNSLQLLKTLGEKLIQLSADRDVIQFDRRETEIKVIDDGFELTERQRYETERYNEQISLLCNMQGAALLEVMEKNHPELQPVFRVHESPLKRRKTALQETLAALVKERSLPQPFQHSPNQSLADYIAGLPDSADAKRLVQAIERQVLMINQASQFRAEPGRHHALGAQSYARFSSPMREIVGIYTHKEILEALGMIEPVDKNQDALIRAQVIEAANFAKQRQKQIGKAIEFAVIDAHLKTDLEESNPHTHLGTVMGFRSGRIYVAIDDLAVDLKVYLHDLAAQYKTEYEIGNVTAEPADENAPKFVLGDEVEVSVKAFNEEKRRYQLNLFSRRK